MHDGHGLLASDAQEKTISATRSTRSCQLPRAQDVTRGRGDRNVDRGDHRSCAHVCHQAPGGCRACQMERNSICDPNRIKGSFKFNVQLTCSSLQAKLQQSHEISSVSNLQRLRELWPPCRKACFSLAPCRFESTCLHARHMCCVICTVSSSKFCHACDMTGGGDQVSSPVRGESPAYIVP